uniref:RING-H2 finger protein ATL46-like n=1 Tax=Nicotiana tabacum TaxID=4097 RepID=A0A1S4DR12_TOBAC|nr:PREDICTED: RING-H2 finger protein ATL46-like [Nicotiana tabacum]
MIDKKCSKFVYNRRAKEPLDCAICLLEFEHGDKGRKIKSCSHIFHENCLDKWLMHGKGQNSNCPVCRSVIIPNYMVEEIQEVEDGGLRFNLFEEELALLLLSGLSNGCSTHRCS